jgi:hypothetical protein
VSDFRDTAREAYLAGWANTQGPMTERVRCGCIVAVDLAVEHEDDPTILETTLRLGSLEGTWAAVYDRREKLYQHHIDVVGDVYRAAASTLNVDGALRRFRQALGITEATEPPDQRRRDEIRTAAEVEAARLLQGLAENPHSPEYQAVIDAIADALMNAQAEGMAGAVAIMADQVGALSIDFDLVFTDAHAALRDLGSYWADAQGWLGQVVNGNAADLGRVLADVAIEGGDFEAMRDAALSVLDGEDIRAVDTLIDLAMGQSFSQGALALYAREGVRSVDFLTAGGSRVCARCMNAESGNPWPLIEAPRPPTHPHCRCVLSPTADSINTLSAHLVQYLTKAA